MTALTISPGQALAVTEKFAFEVGHIEPTWGMFDRRHSWNTMPVSRALPLPPTLRAMESELTRMLCPIKDSGTPNLAGTLAQAAKTLVESYPQRDTATPVYAQQVIRRLAECPGDLLLGVLDTLIDSNPDWRPAPGRVAEAVRIALANRKLLLMRVQAALRWHETRDAVAAEEAEIARDKAWAASRAQRPNDAPLTPIGAAMHGSPGPVCPYAGS